MCLNQYKQNKSDSINNNDNNSDNNSNNMKNNKNDDGNKIIITIIIVMIIINNLFQPSDFSAESTTDLYKFVESNSIKMLFTG